MNKAVKAVMAMALSAGLTVGAASLANAESNCGPTDSEMAPPAMGFRANFDYIFNQLSITEEQGEQVLEILKAQHESMRESRDDDDQQTHSGPPSEDQKEEMQTAMRSELSAVLTPVLTNEQIEGFLDYLEAHMPQGGPHGKGPGRPDFQTDSDNSDTGS